MTKNLNAYEIQIKLNTNILTIRAYSERIKSKSRRSWSVFNAFISMQSSLFDHSNNFNSDNTVKYWNN